MKFFYIIIFFSVFVFSQLGVSPAETTDSLSAHQKIQELTQSMDEMARREAGIRDQQTTRIMRIEEDLETMKQSLTGSLSEMESRHSQELTLIREYLEILNSEIDVIKNSTNLNKEQISELSSSQDSLGQEINALSFFKKDFPQEIQAQIENNRSEIDKKLSEISSRIQDQDSKISSLESIEGRISETSSDFSSLEDKTTQLSEMIEQILEDQEKIIEQTQENLRKKIGELSLEIESWDQGIVDRLNISQEKIQEIEEKAKEREQYLGIAILGAGFMALAGIIFGMLSFVKARKYRNKTSQTLEELHGKVNEQGTILDTRLVELIEKQIPVIPDQKSQDVSEQNAGIETDHTLALVLGEEIFKIMKRKKELSEGSQSFEQLKASLRRMWAAFKEKGYELVDLQNKPYHEDMEVQAEFFLTHELLPGEQVISKVISPLIKYNGKTIQKGKIEVLVGE